MAKLYISVASRTFVVCPSISDGTAFVPQSYRLVWVYKGLFLLAAMVPHLNYLVQIRK